MRKTLGFTLIEVMIAVTVLSLGLITAVFVVTEHTNTLLHLRNNTVGHWVIDLIQTDVRAKLWKNDSIADKDQGTRSYWGINWEWHYQIANDKQEGIRSITIQVKPNKGGESIEQVIYVPVKIAS
jgi:general secretion pathway protein I